MQRGTVARERGLELQALALRHDGDAVFSDGAAQEDAVAGTSLIGRELDACRHNADTGSVDEQAVRAAFLDNLGIAGDDLHIGSGRCPAQGIHNAPQHFDRQALLNDESGTEIQGRCPPIAKSLTVPCTASEPMSPPGKKSGFTTNESVVKATRQPFRSTTALVVQTRECRVAKGGQEDLRRQLRRQFAAAAMSKQDVDHSWLSVADTRARMTLHRT